MAEDIPPPAVAELLPELLKQPDKLRSLLELVRDATATLPDSGYPHWNRLIHLPPPSGFTHREWWLGLKLARGPGLRTIPLTDPSGKPFVYTMPDRALELLHFIDQHVSGEIAMAEVALDDEAARRRYLVNSLIEEAIRSSQLEGATTTHRVAKEMIRSGREPRDRSERMIFNNYRAMEFMHEAGRELAPEMVLELQRILTEGTLDNPDAAGRLQQAGEERVVVWDSGEGKVIHNPPPADQLEHRLSLMCQFANGETGGTGFLHPVVRAVLLHFWLAYDHPFEDGNGRTARALFYWSMRTQGYWLTEYLSISRILREAPSKYGRAFLFTETDDRDTTYFILYHLEVIRRAIDELHAYLQREMREIREFDHFVRATDTFNHRQLALLMDAVRNPASRYTFRSHARSHRVSHQTARTDLLGLRDRGLLELRRVGRAFVFTPVPDLARMLKRPDNRE